MCLCGERPLPHWPRGASVSIERPRADRLAAGGARRQSPAQLVATRTCAYEEAGPETSVSRDGACGVQEFSQPAATSFTGGPRCRPHRLGEIVAAPHVGLAPEALARIRRIRPHGTAGSRCFCVDQDARSSAGPDRSTKPREPYGGEIVLNGIDLNLPEGAIFALLGPAAGKTTVPILSTLIAPRSRAAVVARRRDQPSEHVRLRSVEDLHHSRPRPGASSRRTPAPRRYGPEGAHGQRADGAFAACKGSEVA